MDLRDKVRELAQSCLGDESLFIIDIILSAKTGTGRVLVILDGDKEVTIETCAKVSRTLAKALDDSSLMDDNYTLEVTTPGLDHPLKLKRQYYKNVGRGFRIHTKDKNVVHGTLAEVDDQKITLQQLVKEGNLPADPPTEVVGRASRQGIVELKKIEIPFEHIEKAFVMVSFK